VPAINLGILILIVLFLGIGFWHLFISWFLYRDLREEDDSVLRGLLLMFAGRIFDTVWTVGLVYRLLERSPAWMDTVLIATGILIQLYFAVVVTYLTWHLLQDRIKEALSRWLKGEA